jgi:nuclease S1
MPNRRLDGGSRHDDNQRLCKMRLAATPEAMMTGSKPRRSKFALAVALLAMGVMAPPVLAWGRLGHRVIFRLAEQHLTPHAKVAVAGVLAPGESLADASTWAEDVRGQMRESAAWHDVDPPPDWPRYDPKFSGPTCGCVVDKINEFKLVIKDTSNPIKDRRFALEFLIHFIEDMHQPCHVGDNYAKGGNQTQVQWFKRGSNMHRVWDSGNIERAGTTEEFWLKALAALDTAENRNAWMGGAVEEWATESLLAARAAYQVPGTDKRLKSGQKLAEDYYNAQLPIARQPLGQAGLRFAWVLNEAFSEK